MENNSKVLELISRIQTQAKFLKEESANIDDTTLTRFKKEDLVAILDFIAELLPLISKYLKK